MLLNANPAASFRPYPFKSMGQRLIYSVIHLAAAISLAGTAAAQLPAVTECGRRIHGAEGLGFVPLPQGDLFCPLVADPKEPRSSLSYQRGRSPAEPADDGHPGPLTAFDTEIGAIGIGDAFGLVRWGGPRPGEGLQISISAGVFAQFDLAAPSYDLINADYLVGLPITYRRGGFSSRLRIYHQSSHLGDEFLLREEPERVNLAFESLELIVSQAAGVFRVYGGGELLFNREPDDLESMLAHAGLELRSGAATSRSIVAAIDLKSSEEQDWKPAWSARAGFELRWGRDPEHPPRTLRLLGEYYDGPSPYGQFYREQLRYWGVGVHISL